MSCLQKRTGDCGNSGCPNCGLTEDQVKTLITHGGLAPQIGEIMCSLIVNNLHTVDKTLIGALFELNNTLESKLDKTPTTEFIANQLTVAQIEELVRKLGL